MTVAQQSNIPSQSDERDKPHSLVLDVFDGVDFVVVRLGDNDSSKASQLVHFSANVSLGNLGDQRVGTKLG